MSKLAISRLPIDALNKDIQNCQICDNLPLGPRPILKLEGQGKILIAGQAPGSITHAKGIPFDDPSGVHLRAWLGIDRETFYNDPRLAILPMGFCFPGSGKGGDVPPRTECAASWRNLALAQMPELELILVIGRYAIDWHLPELSGQRIADICANWETHLPKHIVLPHPSPRNNRWLKQNQQFERDIVPYLQARVSEILNSKQIA